MPLTMVSMPSLVACALKPGPSRPPARLLALLSGYPPGYLASSDDHDRWFEALDRDFPFILAATHRLPSNTEVAIWSDLLRWLVGELQGWTGVSDPDSNRLTALLALVAHMELAAPLWPVLAPALQLGLRAAAGLEHFIRTRSAELSLPEDAPEHERKFLDRFNADDAALAWEQADEALHRLPLQLSWSVGQASRALAHFDFQRLVIAADAAPTLVDVLGIVKALSPQHQADLAVASSSERLHFAVVRSLVQSRTAALSASVEQAIAKVLVTVAADSERWQTWLWTFARYPVRHPAIQAPFGLALAHLPLKAQHAFLEICEPSTDVFSRDCLSRCFDAFRHAANLPVRQGFWAAAYRRWEEWGYPPQAVVHGPARSSFDAALIGYFVETLPIAELRGYAADCRQKLMDSGNGWYQSLNEARWARSRLISRLLLAEHALLVIQRSDPWLDRTRPAVPAYASSVYLDLKWGF